MRGGCVCPVQHCLGTARGIVCRLGFEPRMHDCRFRRIAVDRWVQSYAYCGMTNKSFRLVCSREKGASLGTLTQLFWEYRRSKNTCHRHSRRMFGSDRATGYRIGIRRPIGQVGKSPLPSDIDDRILSWRSSFRGT
jgi:hypothetical protein